MNPINTDLAMVLLLLIVLLAARLLAQRTQKQLALAPAGVGPIGGTIALAADGETHRSNKAFGRYNNFGRPTGMLDSPQQPPNPNTIGAALYLGALASRGGKRGKLTSGDGSVTKARRYRQPKPKYGGTNRRPAYRGSRKR